MIQARTPIYHLSNYPLNLILKAYPDSSLIVLVSMRTSKAPVGYLQAIETHLETSDVQLSEVQAEISSLEQTDDVLSLRERLQSPSDLWKLLFARFSVCVKNTAHPTQERNGLDSLRVLQLIQMAVALVVSSENLPEAMGGRDAATIVMNIVPGSVPAENFIAFGDWVFIRPVVMTQSLKKARAEWHDMLSTLNVKQDLDKSRDGIINFRRNVPEAVPEIGRAHV